jgi:hypothetical protein
LGGVVDKKQFAGYVAFKKDEAGSVISRLSILTDKEKIEKWLNGEKVVDINNSDLPQEAAKAELNPLGILVNKYIESMMGFHRLSRISYSIIPTMRSSYINEEIRSHVEKNLDKISDDSRGTIYGIKLEQYGPVSDFILKLKELDVGYEALPSSTILSLVATFDSYISDIVRILLLAKPERYESSSKSMSIKDILSMKSFDDVIEKIVDDEIDALMRGSHEEQIKFIESNFSVSIREKYEKWSKFIEIFERRNIIAHGNMVINRIYVTNCNTNGFNVDVSKIGTKLDLNYSYMRKSIDLLMEFGLLLIFSLWRKHYKDSEDASSLMISDIAYDLIRRGRYSVANGVLDFALNKQKPPSKDNIKRIMIVNHANANKKMKNEDVCKKILSGTDWSASSDNYKICVASLNENVEAVLSLMPKVASAESVSKDEFREWPALDWVRNDDRVIQKFMEVYGEPMKEVSSEGFTTNDGSSSEEPSGKIPLKEMH